VNPAWVAALAALAGIVFGLLGWICRGLIRFVRRLYDFLEDWQGNAGDAGHTPRPGVMERLVKLEHVQADVQAQVGDVQAQVHLNSGTSLKDAVTRTEARVDQLGTRLTDVQVQVGVVQTTVNELKAR
jgi:hypothetical protein